MRMKKGDIHTALDMISFIMGPQQSESEGLQTKLQDTPFFGIPPWGKSKYTKYLNIMVSVDTGQGDTAQILMVLRAQKSNFNGIKYFYVNKYGMQEVHARQLPNIIKQECEEVKDGKKTGRTLKRTLDTTGSYYAMEWKNGGYIDFQCPKCAEFVRECRCLECPDCGEECAPVTAILSGEEEVFYYCEKCDVKFYAIAQQERLAIMWLQTHEGLHHLTCICGEDLGCRVDVKQSGHMQLYCEKCDHTQELPKFVLESYVQYEKDRADELKKKRKEVEHVTRVRGE